MVFAARREGLIDRLGSVVDRESKCAAEADARGQGGPEMATSAAMLPARPSAKSRMRRGRCSRAGRRQRSRLNLAHGQFHALLAGGVRGLFKAEVPLQFLAQHGDLRRVGALALEFRPQIRTRGQNKLKVCLFLLGTFRSPPPSLCC